MHQVKSLGLWCGILIESSSSQAFPPIQIVVWLPWYVYWDDLFWICIMFIIVDICSKYFHVKFQIILASTRFVWFLGSQPEYNLTILLQQISCNSVVSLYDTCLHRMVVLFLVMESNCRYQCQSQFQEVQFHWSAIARAVITALVYISVVSLIVVGLVLGTIPQNAGNMSSCISWQAACQTHNAHVVSGCGDGSVRLYDIRSRDM